MHNFQVGTVYYISKGTLKLANKLYSNVPNDYEMVINNGTVIEKCKQDESKDIPKIEYNFVPIKDIAEKATNAVIDVIGVCSDVGQLQAFVAKTSGKEMKKRDVTLVDNS